MLDRLAAASPFSSVDLQDRIKARHSRPLQVDEVFSTIFRRLYSSEAKWMVRMLLKTYSPVLLYQGGIRYVEFKSCLKLTAGEQMIRHSTEFGTTPPFKLPPAFIQIPLK